MKKSKAALLKIVIKNLQKKIQKNQKLFAKKQKKPKKYQNQIHSEKKSQNMWPAHMSVYADSPEKTRKKIIVTYKKGKIFRYFNQCVELPL